MIFLKRLELQGFKSFAGKTILDFTARVAGVVGPNGSGKSNVIDALRWVLGEREAKQLRGDLLEHLIFAGTPKRPAVGLAKVTLYFDNAHGQFPFDAPEIALQRRVDRSGTSEFFINDEEVKLRDLVSMLARAKLGARGLTMIGQGQSDMFVKSSAEERRIMIEEVLGLKEFRIKKSQAERRLVTSGINMDKTRAMVEELLPHLRFLRRQKHRWDKRSEVEQELRNLEDTYYAFQYHRLLVSLKIEGGSHVEELEKIKKQKEKDAQDLETQVRGVEQKISAPEKIQSIRNEISELQKKQLAFERTLARIEVRIEFESKEKDVLLKNTEELTQAIQLASKDVEHALTLNDIPEIKSVLQKILNSFSGLWRGVEKKDVSVNLEEEKMRVKSELEKIVKDIGDLQGAEDALTREQQEANKKFREYIEVLESKKNEIRKLDQQIQTQLFEKEKVHIRISEIEREWHALGREVAELRSLPPTSEINLNTDEIERRMLKLRGELAAIGEIDQNLVQEASESEKRYEFLTTELQDLEKAIADLKKLIKNLDEKINEDFKSAFKLINEEFNKYFRLMFGGGKARMFIEKKKKPEIQEGTQKDGEMPQEVAQEEDREDLSAGVEIELNLPKKKITSLEMLSGGEKSLVSIAALFALIAVSPPPFLVLDEIDAPLDESNTRRFAELVKDFSTKTQFIIVTHNRATMEVADILYGVTMADDGVSKILSLKFEDAPKK
jgi:chromosome segregation protein